MLGGYETCFGIMLDPKTSPNEQTRFNFFELEQYIQIGSGDNLAVDYDKCRFSISIFIDKP